jgi:lauroyl/myristoyl acyltransferase
MSLPERIGLRVFDAFAHVAYHALPGVRATVAANQARVVGLEAEDDRVRAATVEAFELYARYWFDTFRIRVLAPDEVNRRTQMIEVEHIDRALEVGSGCICVLPHMGNWDLAGHHLAINGYRIASVAEELKPRRLTELFLAHREQLGMRIVPLTKGAHVGTQLARLLKDNWVVALVADRDLNGRGIEAEMFGAPRQIPAGPALLALSTGAPLLVCPVYTTPHGWIVRIGKPIEIERSGTIRTDVATLTRAMAAEFERAISARPADWHMFQPAWTP